jgi:hypothetical protein
MVNPDTSGRTQQLLSYNQIHRLTGMPQVAVGKMLSPTEEYCKLNRLPPLTSIVVNENEWVTGCGFHEGH